MKGIASLGESRHTSANHPHHQPETLKQLPTGVRDHVNAGGGVCLANHHHLFRFSDEHLPNRHRKHVDHPSVGARELCLAPQSGHGIESEGLTI